MALFAISDLHLALDPSLDKPMDVFDAAWMDHTEKLEYNWKRTVHDDDVVVIPGDISWGISLAQSHADLSFIDSLPGNKILLRGNHDYWWASMAKMRGLYPSIGFIQNDCYEAKDYVLCGCRGWSLPWNNHGKFTAEESDKIYRRELLRLQMTLTCASDKALDRPIVAAMHFPPFDRDHLRTEFTQLFHEYGVSKVVYGHLHSSKNIETAVCGVVDGIEYNLVSFDKLDGMPLKII